MSGTQRTVDTPDLRLAAVRIQDFRILRDLAIDLDPSCTLIVGENNTGKSALLIAIGRALGHGRSDEDDLHVDATGRRAEQFVVDLRFEPATGLQFSDEVAELFGTAVQRPTRPGGAEYVTLRAVESPSPDGGGLRRRRSFVGGWAGDRTTAQRQGSSSRRNCGTSGSTMHAEAPWRSRSSGQIVTCWASSVPEVATGAACSPTSMSPRTSAWT